jgi:putative flippase GtrA
LTGIAPVTQPRELGHQVLRFLAVGALNALFGYGLFALLIFLGVHYAAAVLLSTIAGVLFNFKTTGRLVFGSGDNRLLLRFVAVYAVVYAVNVLLLKALLAAGIGPYAGGALLILPMAALAFILMKRLVFTHA